MRRSKTQREIQTALPTTLYVWAWEPDDPTTGYAAVTRIEDIDVDAKVVGVYKLDEVTGLQVTRTLGVPL